MEDLRYYAEEKIREGIAKAEKHFNKTFPFPEIRFDLKGRRAGQAWYSKNLIRFNPSIFRNNENEFINRTIPHELAHLIAYQVFGNAGVGHKDCWKLVCRVLGMSDITRCHRYKAGVVKARQRKPSQRFAFSCDCSTHYITKIRVTKIANGKNYRCVRCKSRLHEGAKPI